MKTEIFVYILNGFCIGFAICAAFTNNIGSGLGAIALALLIRVYMEKV